MFYEGLRCPVCGKPFTANDDIVVCPTCGLPHHRACWQQEGHCHLDSLHGTPQQWKREDEQTAPDDIPTDEEDTEQVCPGCGAHNPEYAEFCKSRGRPLGEKDWHSCGTGNGGAPCNEYKPFYAPVNPSYAYSEDELIDGDRATELAAFVGSRTDYYIPRFRQLAQGRGGGFNWAALLLGPYWMLYRRMFAGGIALLVLQVIQLIISNVAFARMSITSNADLYALLQRLSEGESLSRVQMLCLASVWLISFIILAARIVVGVMGNRLYRIHCANGIRRAKHKAPDISVGELAFLGGTSVAIAIIGYIAQYFLVQIIAMLL